MKWTKKPIDAEEVRSMSQRFDLDLLEASILVRRGVNEPSDLLSYLEDDLRFAHNPFLFQSMEDAVDRILGARDDEERVLVFGDRDVDGMTSTVLMVEALQDLGIADVTYKLPQGDDSYGLSEDAVADFAQGGGGLIVTVDCGISNVKEIELANSLGIDVLVVDHHVPPAVLPDALAIVNPKLETEPYPFKSLAACAVVSKLVWALRFAATPLYNQRLCLLHCHTEEGILVVEALRMVNLVERKRLRLVFGPSSSSSDLQTLAFFLENQEIFVFDEKTQVKHLRSLFGPRADIGVFDLAPQIRQAFPALAQLSFAEIKVKSRLPRYRDSAGDLDILASLFTSSIYKAFPRLGAEYVPILDLVSLGTVADLMPLEGENRILVRLGMRALNQTKREGLRSLLMRLKILGKPLSTTDVSWSVTPVINAAGRMGTPQTAVELLLTKDEQRRKALAIELEGLNQERKSMSLTAWDVALPSARASFKELGERMIVVYDAQIPRGIIGVLASKLMGMFGVPSLVLTVQDQRVIGSLRANRGFETRRFLDRFQDLFTDYGGHAQAAGFNLPLEKYPEFFERLKKTLAEFPLQDDAQAAIEIDAELPTEYLKPDLMHVVDRLEPYGEGHRPLTFCAKNLCVVHLDLVGKQGASHVKMTLDAGAYKWPAIYWNALEKYEKNEFALGDRVDVAFQIGRNYYHGQEQVQLTVLDVVRTRSN